MSSGYLFVCWLVGRLVSSFCLPAYHRKKEKEGWNRSNGQILCMQSRHMIHYRKTNCS